MLAVLLLWIALASLATGLLYAWDKHAAIGNRPRIKESTLLLCSLLGGWPGGVLVGKKIRHKTQKVSYRIKFAACVIINLIIVVVLVRGFGL